MRELGELFGHGLEDLVVLWLSMNEAELHSHPAQIGVSEGFYETGFVVVTAPTPGISCRDRRSRIGAVATPDFGELLYGLGGEEIVRVQIVEKRNGFRLKHSENSVSGWKYV